MKIIKWFAERMEAWLREENDCEWEVEDRGDLMRYFSSEVEEFDGAVFADKPPAEIIARAATVACRAMMIADNVRAQESRKILTFRDKAKRVLDHNAYNYEGERLLLEAYLRGEVKEIWNLKALIDCRFEKVTEPGGDDGN